MKNAFIVTSFAIGIATTAMACGNDDGATPPLQSGGADSGLGAGGGAAASGGAAGSDARGGSGGISGASAVTGGAAGDAGGSVGTGGAGDTGGVGNSGDAGGGTGGAPGSGGTAGTGGVGTGGTNGTGGTGTFPCNGPGSRYATGSPDHVFGTGQNYQQDLFPVPVLGPPKGGAAGGSLDVVSLGNGGYVVVEFDGNAIVDGPGPDFIVFENVFLVGNDPANPFAELATVAVSDDGRTWTEFPCTATAYPWGSCAGWHPTYANPDTNTIDPTDPSVAGGDAFDLADIGVARARYVKVTDRADLTGTTEAFDLDAVSIHNAACP